MYHTPAGLISDALIREVLT